MARPEQTNTQAFEFSPSLLPRLNLYALGAAAAGVGMLASATPSEAKVVYTPAHVVIPGGGYLLDLNHDGINDFNLNLNGTTNGHSDSGFLSARPIASRNLIWGQGKVEFGFHPRVAAFDLPAGVQLGPNNERAVGQCLRQGPRRRLPRRAEGLAGTALSASGAIPVRELRRSSDDGSDL